MTKPDCRRNDQQSGESVPQLEPQPISGNQAKAFALQTLDFRSSSANFAPRSHQDTKKDRIRFRREVRLDCERNENKISAAAWNVARHRAISRTGRGERPEFAASRSGRPFVPHPIEQKDA